MAPSAVNPVRHSSCAMAGIPKALPATTSDWSRDSFAAPSATLTGAVPYTRVRCPSPPSMASGQGRSSEVNSVSMGATSCASGSGAGRSPSAGSQ